MSKAGHCSATEGATQWTPELEQIVQPRFRQRRSLYYHLRNPTQLPAAVAERGIPFPALARPVPAPMPVPPADGRVAASYQLSSADDCLSCGSSTVGVERPQRNLANPVDSNYVKRKPSGYALDSRANCGDQPSPRRLWQSGKRLVIPIATSHARSRRGWMHQIRPVRWRGSCEHWPTGGFL